MNIIEAMTDPALFGKQFSGATWANWRTLIAGFYGLKCNAATFKKLTQRKPPKTASNEFYLVVGRRGGKSNISALMAVYEACFNDYSDKLAPGEIATVMVIAADRKQARSVMRYIRGLLESNPMLERMIVRDGQEVIELSNRCAIEIMTASHKSIRGYTVSAAICDEIAFWSNDGANPDREILNALRPAMATLGGKLICLSSPYARRGVLWEAYKKHYGKDGRVLVAQAPTQLMNSTIDVEVINQARLDDPAAAAAEYDAEFRKDVETFISPEVVDSATAYGRREFSPVSSNRYFAFTDPAGGSGKDAMTLAVAHQEDGVYILDAIRSRKPPFSPEAVVADFCEFLKTYRVTEVVGDRYAGEWPREQFRKRGINYKVSDKVRSDIYRDLLPLLNSGKVQLLDEKQLHRELCGLERRTARGGKDTIDHAPGAHDDIANAVAGALLLCAEPAANFVFTCDWGEPQPVTVSGLAARGSNRTDELFARGRSLDGLDDGAFYF